MKNNNKAIGIIGIAIVVIMAVVLIIAIAGKSGSNRSSNEQTTSQPDVVENNDDLSLDELAARVTVREAEKKKGVVSFDSNNLYDELPEIDKYPLAVTGQGELDIEIFTSGEKAGKDSDSWLIDVANAFNASGAQTADGRSVSMSVRSVASGTAADYIISNKYLPDLYTPSNTLFGEYAKVNGGDLTLYEERLVGNTAGILVKKGTYSDFDSVIKAVQNNEINVGYTNPQTSATGLNLLLTLLKDGTENFTSFNANIPYVAYTTQQMRDSASNGNLDGMLTEYQAYINDENLTSLYDFIPFGVRHDNPVYLCGESSKTPEELEAVKMVVDFGKSDAMQRIATEKGFNANDDYTTELAFSGAEVNQGLVTYKKEKDNGKDIIAVFVADCSGSMAGEPMQQLKASLSNGLSYINENNYIGLISYSSDVVVELPIEQLDLNQRAYFQGAIDNMDANGNTSTYEAIVIAAKMIEEKRAEHPDAKCMIILLSDGYANGYINLEDIQGAIKNTGIPVYTIGYGGEADKEALSAVSNINEAASINADSEDIVYKLKSLFNSQL